MRSVLGGRGGEGHLREVEEAERAVENIGNEMRGLWSQRLTMMNKMDGVDNNTIGFEKLSREIKELEETLKLKEKIYAETKANVARLKAEPAGHVDLRGWSGGGLWRNALERVRSALAGKKDEKEKIEQHYRYQEAAERDAARYKQEFLRELDDPQHPLNWLNQDSFIVRALKREEERGRAILEAVGKDSDLFSKKGTGQRSFRAYGQDYWAKDPNDPRFRRIKHGEAGARSFETGPNMSRVVGPAAAEVRSDVYGPGGGLENRR